MEALARAADRELRVYLVGGTTAVLVGWRSSTIDVDLVTSPENDALPRAIPAIKERLRVNVELASRLDFIPEPELYRYPALHPPSFRRAVEVAARGTG